jgi:hypothetical protein
VLEQDCQEYGKQREREDLRPHREKGCIHRARPEEEAHGKAAKIPKVNATR